MAIWLFDSQCVLCTYGVQHTLKHEKRPSIRFVSIQSDDGRILAEQHLLDPDDPATFLFIEGERVLEQSDAMIALSRHLNGPARMLWVFRVLPKAMRDACYRFIARNRYRVFGRVKTCIIPTPNQRERFVL